MNYTSALHLEERAGINRANEPVCIGVPFPKGGVKDLSAISLVAVAGEEIVFQAKPLMLWSDGSIRWLLVDFLANISAHGQQSYFFKARDSQDQLVGSSFIVNQTEMSAEVEYSKSRFSFQDGMAKPIFVRSDSNTENPSIRCELRYADCNGTNHLFNLKSVAVEETGPVRTRVLLKGELALQRKQINMQCRVDLYAGTGSCRMEVSIHNPSSALHPGGIWDLGDPGSIRFSDLSLVITGIDSAGVLEWQPEPGLPPAITQGKWALYQDSSGGKHWDSPNHVGADGQLTVRFPGYRAYEGDGGRSVLEGRRAAPWVRCPAGDLSVSMGVEHFWQNFPKAIRREGDEVIIGLFPKESAAGFELQGGERKRHVVWMQISEEANPQMIVGMLQPLSVSLDPEWVEASKAVSYFTPENKDPEQQYRDYLQHAIAGTDSFFAKREAIDEYGWRNFGDIYADHEAAFHTGTDLYPSHYNNQYDFIYGAFCHFLRSGDQRWRELMEDLARHVADIDIYHTDDDRAAYNHGQFWHSYHYQPAGTGTHRGFSKVGIPDGHQPFYGGGPSNEHNYASGLLHYHLLTGDPWAREAVLELAGWSIAMDDGSKTLLGILDDGPTGLASQTGSPDYHHPGRGAGNCINTLLDAYSLTRSRIYLDKAEELIRRCIHPKDNISTLKLDEPEIRWFYLVFLQILGKYLDSKIEMGEHDYMFFYARDSLLHYAEWVHVNEVPYKELLHKVEYPTETWSAQDVRKACVLNIASKYVPTPEKRLAYREKASLFFRRCLEDLLTFNTAYLVRPMVLLTVYGTQQGYFERHADEFIPYRDHIHDFAEPVEFRNQRQRVKDSFKLKLKVTMREAKRSLLGKIVEMLPVLKKFIGN